MLKMCKARASLTELVNQPCEWLWLLLGSVCWNCILLFQLLCGAGKLLRDGDGNYVELLAYASSTFGSISLLMNEFDDGSGRVLHIRFLLT